MDCLLSSAGRSTAPPRVAWGFTLALLALSTVATAQVPNLTGLAPARHAASAPRTANVALTFSQPMSAATASGAAVRVFSSRRGGLLTRPGSGIFSGGSTPTVTFDPATDFRPGEVVSVTTTTAAQSTGGQPLTTGHVYQFTAAAGASPATFAGTGTDLAMGAQPLASTAADVDGDGDLDLLSTSNVLGGGVLVRRNDGSGTFGPPVTVVMNGFPCDLATADLDGDGDLDLLSVTQLAGVISVRFNDGTGAFTGTTDVPVGTFPRSIAVGDVDADGDLDLLAANSNDGNVSVKLNNGAGAFSGSTTVPVSAGPYFVTLGDVDADGDLDLLTANGISAVSVRLNNGSGAFSAPGGGAAEVAVDPACYTLTLGDVDADGDLDLLAASQATHSVGVCLNNGVGRFGPPTAVPVVHKPSSVALADVDGDGDLDLLASNFTSFGSVSVRLNAGGTFGGGPDVPVNDSPIQLGVADFDGDGTLDLYATSGVTGTVNLHLNAVPVPPFALLSTTPGYNAEHVAGGDLRTFTFNQPYNGASAGGIHLFSAQAGGHVAGFFIAPGSGGANSVDIGTSAAFRAGELVNVSITTQARSLTTGQFLARGHVRQFRVAAGGGPATFQPVWDAQVGIARADVALADVNGDGVLDLLAADPDFARIVVQRGNGVGRFGTGTALPDVAVGDAPKRLLTADFNEDGHEDLAVMNYNDQTVSIRLGDGTGHFTSAPDLPAAPPAGLGLSDLVAADVNADGYLDLVATHQQANLAYVFLGTGAGTFGAPTTVPVGAQPQRLALADCNNDGFLDLLTAHRAPHLVQIRLGDGTGSFVLSATTLALPATSRVTLQVGDLNHDSFVDVVTTEFDFHTARIFLGDGVGGLGVPTTLTLGAEPTAAALGDVNGDGDLDLLTTHYSAGTAEVRLGDGLGSFLTGARPDANAAFNPVALTLADLDHDGDLDFVTSDQFATQVGVRLNQVLVPPFAMTSHIPTVSAPAVGAAATQRYQFNQPYDLLTSNAVRVFSAQTGRVSGLLTGISGNELFVNTPAPLRPGEEINVTVTSDARSNSTGEHLIQGHVNQFRVAAGVGPATFQATRRVGARSLVTSTVAADVDGDGNVDLLIASNSASAVQVRRGDGTGFFEGGAPLPDVAVGYWPVRVLTGDFNEDGHVDLATANYYNSLSVRLGDGAGHFTGAANLPISTGAGGPVAGLCDLVAGDVDGDGHLDLVAAHLLTNSVYVLLGTGTGTFGAPVAYAVGVRPSRLALADYNNDGFLDLYTVHSFPTVVEVRQNIMTGGFDPTASLTTSSIPTGGTVTLLLADLNHDGFTDIVTTEHDSHTARVFLRTPSSLGTPATVVLGAEPTDAALADVNGDGNLDLLTTHHATATMEVRLGTSAGAFLTGARPDVAIGTDPNGITLADFDGDLDLDVVTSHFYATALEVYLNEALSVAPFALLATTPTRNAGNVSLTGVRTFTFNQPFDASSGVTIQFFSAVAGGDRSRSLLAPGAGGANSVDYTLLDPLLPGEVMDVTVMRQARSATTGQQLARGQVHQFRAVAGAGPGTFSGTIQRPVGGVVRGVALADVNEDGDLDLLAANATTNSVSVAMGDGAGHFGTPASVSVGTSPSSVTAADINGDTHLDLLTANWGDSSVSVHLGDGTGAFTDVNRLWVGQQPIAVVTADIDADGDLDLLILNRTNPGTVKIRLNDGTGTFFAADEIRVGRLPQGIAVADVDADGDLDFAVSNSSDQNVGVYLNNGLGAFLAAPTVPVGVYPADVALADVTGDGLLDLLCANVNASTVSVKPGDGAGHFGPGTTVAVGDGPYNLRVGDVNGDGHLDLVTINSYYEGGWASVRLGTGTGAFTGAHEVALPHQPFGLALGDLDGDLDLDMVVGNTIAANGVSVRLNQPLTDLVVSTAQVVASNTYRNVTITGLGRATLGGGPLSVNGSLVVQTDGVLDPAASCEVIIGAGTFTLEPDAALTICSPFGLSATGPSGQVIVAGTRSYDSGARYTYVGSPLYGGPQFTGLGLPAVVSYLTIAHPVSVTLLRSTTITRCLTMAGTGDLLLSNRDLTLLSTPFASAMVANLGTGRVVNNSTGRARVECWQQNTTYAGYGYHHLSAPVTGATVAGLACVGYSPAVNPAYNALPTPPMATLRPYPNIFGFDERRAPTSADFGLGWFSPATTSATLDVGRGYATYLRGGATPVFTGALVTGDQTLSLTRTGTSTGPLGKSGWHLLGNPFPAPFNWDALTVPAGMSQSISVFQPTGANTGVYLTRANGMGSLPGGILPIGQAFFVRVTDAGPVALTLPNSARQSTWSGSPAHYRPGPPVATADPRPAVHLALRASGASGAATDATVVYFQAGATAGLDAAFDGERPAHNQGVPTLLSLTAAEGEELAVNGLPVSLLATGTVVELLLDLPAAGPYELTCPALANLAGVPVALLDRKLGTRTVLTPGTTYPFTVGSAGVEAGRFALEFAPAGTVTGTSDLSPLTSHLTIYPNPASPGAQVRVLGVAAGRVVTLLDATGRTLRVVAATATGATLDVAGLPAGVYTVRAGQATRRLVVE